MRAARRSWSFAAMIAALAMLGPFSIDMYLPAFPAIGDEFAAAPIAVQQSLSIYLFTFAFMMLWHGALSDALGRKPIILGSLVVYGIATLGCALSGSIESLWLFRGLQGISSGAGLVVGRAIIRDRFQGVGAQKLMSQITLVFSLAPALAPVLGGFLLASFGWRSIFWVLLLMVAGLSAWTALMLDESLPRDARQPLHPVALWRNYRMVLSHGDFLLLALVPAFNLCAFFLYIASAPVFLIDLLGTSAQGFGWLFVPMIAGVVLGASLSGRLAGRLSFRRTINLGYAIMFLGVAVNLAVCWLAAPGIPWNVLPIMIFTFGSSLVMPSATLMLLDIFPRMRGLASSLQNFAQFTLAAVTAGTIAPFLARSVMALALGMGGLALAGFMAWRAHQWRARARGVQS